MNQADVTRAPLASITGQPSPQTESAVAASTAEKAIADNTTGGALYEFVATGNVHVKFGLTTMGAATAADALVTTFPRRFFIDPALITHIRVIRSTADSTLSFSRVR
jgi:hypothetical protein